jgi:hypothetical protein
MTRLIARDFDPAAARRLAAAARLVAVFDTPETLPINPPEGPGV